MKPKYLGYSNRLIKLNAQADRKSLGVKLGAVCMLHDVPVSVVADKLGVSRQTIYNWFNGATSPKDSLTEDVKHLIRTYSRRK